MYFQEPRPFHLGLEHNCTGLINSSSFRSKVEAAAQGCKSNPNPLWAPILWTIKTKSSAAAVPAGHKTLGKHPERAAKQLAGWGTTRAETVRAGRRRRPCRWAGGGRQGSKSILKGGSWAAARRDSRGHARPAPGGNGALAKKATKQNPTARAGTGLRDPPEEWAGETGCAGERE